jgi:hypothetical protein
MAVHLPTYWDLGVHARPADDPNRVYPVSVVVAVGFHPTAGSRYGAVSAEGGTSNGAGARPKSDEARRKTVPGVRVRGMNPPPIGT